QPIESVFSGDRERLAWSGSTTIRKRQLDRQFPATIYSQQRIRRDAMSERAGGVLDLFRLQGKVALVTGAASGLGAGIAAALAEAGARVACHGNRRAATE